MRHNFLRSTPLLRGDYVFHWTASLRLIAFTAAIFLFSPLIAAAPTITSVSPRSGPTSGGTVVTINGTDLQFATSVTFGGSAGTNIGYNSSTGKLQATTPSRSAGSVSVKVVCAAGTVTSSNAFTYTDPSPTITSVSPSIGPSSGGTVVTINGTNLQFATSVTFGGTAATNIEYNSSTGKLQATTPSHSAGSVGVTVVAAAGTVTSSNAFTYTAPSPTITSVSPNSGPSTGGTVVTIDGTNLQFATSVTFGGVAGTNIGYNSDTGKLQATTPARSAGSVSVTVVCAAGTVTSANAFTYTTPAPAPTITSVSPNSGPSAGGTVVTIDGTNLQFATSVTFGGVAGTNIGYNSDTGKLQATTPARSAGSVSVTVVCAAGTVTSANAFTYTTPAPIPTITSVSPSSGPSTGGTVVTIDGTNLQFATSVTFGGVAATNIGYNSAAKLQVTTAAHSAGAVSVNVVCAAGTVTSSNAFTYTSTSPSVPSAPRNVTASRGDQQITLGWAAPSSNGGAPVTSYRVLRGTMPSNRVAVTTGMCASVGAVLSCTDTGLTNGQSYNYVVTAVNSAGQGLPSEAAIATPAAGQEIPIAKFTWTPPTPAAGKAVQFSDASSGGPTVWRWDFNGDGSVDSHAPQPVWLFASAGSHAVTLTVTNNAGTSTVTNSINVISATVTISGSVFTGDRAAIRGSVGRTVSAVDGQGRTIATVSIAQDGSYELRVPPGTYRLRTHLAYIQRYLSPSQQNIDDIRFATKWTDVRLFATSETLDIPLPAPVALLHGLLSSPETWDEWIRITSEDRPDQIILRPYYHWALPVEDGADAVYTDLTASLRDIFVDTPRYRIIAHSKGGLVARAFLNRYAGSHVVDHVSDLVMLGTPNSGTQCPIARSAELDDCAVRLFNKRYPT
ncbi:MAG TPA: IPT/TIG domain-containing protein, partial [Thermoanaerobaculia bacterium]